MNTVEATCGECGRAAREHVDDLCAGPRRRVARDYCDSRGVNTGDDLCRLIGITDEVRAAIAAQVDDRPADKVVLARLVQRLTLVALARVRPFTEAEFAEFIADGARRNPAAGDYRELRSLARIGEAA